MAIVGYARVSTLEQSTEAQRPELEAAGCTEIHEEQASGGDRSRPVLGRLLKRLGPGDTLVVVRLDRLARSLVHLLEVIEALEKRGAHFRSIRDPVDTASPQGRFTLQVLGAAAELERALIRERTMSGLAAAKAAGRSGGNPGLKTRDSEAVTKISEARDRNYLARLEAESASGFRWFGVSAPSLPWEDVVRVLRARRPDSRWSVERLKRAAKRYVRDGLLEKSVLDRAPSPDPDDRLVAIVAGIAGADESLSLREIASRLEAMREKTPRGRSKWYPSSVSHFMERARQSGLLAEKGTPEAEAENANDRLSA